MKRHVITIADSVSVTRSVQLVLQDVWYLCGTEGDSAGMVAASQAMQALRGLSARAEQTYEKLEFPDPPKPSPFDKALEQVREKARASTEHESTMRLFESGGALSINVAGLESLLADAVDQAEHRLIAALVKLAE